MHGNRKNYAGSLRATISISRPFREDGATYGTPAWIWSVVVDGALYVRAYNGARSSCYQAALKQKAGRIAAAGITKDVSFEPVSARSTTKSTRYIVRSTFRVRISHMTGKQARAATVRVLPRV